MPEQVPAEDDGTGRHDGIGTFYEIVNLEPLNPKTMNPLDIRLRALDWLFDTIRPWLFQDPSTPQQFPNRNDVDWKAVEDLAYVHNVEPLLYQMASNTVLSIKIPERLKKRWEGSYFGNFLRNEAYFDILKTLLGRCEKEGVSIIVLKGPALIGRIYRDSGFEPWQTWISFALGATCGEL